MYRAWQRAMGLFAGERILIIVPEIDSIDLEDGVPAIVEG